MEEEMGIKLISIHPAPCGGVFLVRSRSYFSGSFCGGVSSNENGQQRTGRLPLCFLLTLPYTFFYIKVAFPFLTGSVLSGSVLQRLMNDVTFTYRFWTLSDIVRLGGDAYNPLYGGGVRPLLGYVLPTLVLSAPLFKQNRTGEKLRLTMGFLVLAGMTTLFVWLTTRGDTLWLFERFPLLFRFRNPARPILLLAFAYAPLIAMAVDGLLNGLSALIIQRRVRLIAGFIALAVIAFSVGFYNKPFFSGDMYLSQNRDNSYEVPKVYYEISQWISKRRSSEGFFRTLWVPWTYKESETKLYWLDPYTFTFPLPYEQYATSPMVDYVRFVLESLINTRTQHIGTLLAPADVKYIILNLTSQQTGPSITIDSYVFGNPQNFVSILDEQKDLKLIVNERQFRIYENQQFVQHITAYNHVAFVAQTKRNPLDAMTALADRSDLPVDKYLLIYDQQLSSLQAEWLLDKLSEGQQKVLVLPRQLLSLHDDFTASILDEKKWKTDGFVTFDKALLNLAMETGATNYLESTNSFTYPVVLATRLKLNTKTSSANIKLAFGEGNLAKFNYFGSDGTFTAITYDSGKYTETDVGAGDTEFHVFKIICEEDRVRFYIDDVLKVIHTTNIPKRNLKVRFDGESGQTFTIDYVKVDELFSDPTPVTTFDLVSDTSVDVSTTKISETEYHVETKSEGPALIVLTEAYDLGWNAYMDNKRLEHFPAFYWANGFYLDTSGKTNIKILYNEQRIKNLTIVISAHGVGYLNNRYHLCLSRDHFS